MVSFPHEALLKLVHDRPGFVADLLTGVLGIPISGLAEVRLTESTLNQPAPVEAYADAAVLLVGGKPVLGVIVEAQLKTEARKQYTWPLYAVAARARHECPFMVLVITLDPQVARWARQAIDLGDGNLFRPRVMGPDQIPKVMDADVARRDPQLAVLSTAAHGKGDPDTAVRIALAAIDAISALPEDQRRVYSDLIEASLSEAARKVLMMLPQNQPFYSELGRRSYERGVGEGKAEGKAEALLKFLALRGLAISDVQRRRILECADAATIDGWLDRALSVASVDELLG
jgi:hypothetical protein